jgi:integral membrane sensor domain MASE1
MQAKVKPFNKFLNFIIPNNVIGICLAPFGIFMKPNYLHFTRVLEHEKIHWKQQMEMLIILFYIWYLVEWIFKLLLFGKRAYYNLSFEREARAFEKTPSARKPYGWLRYIFE